jgi:hypothetical protein
VICVEGVAHCGHGHDGEEESRDLGGAISEVEHANGKGSKYDGKVQPGEKGTLVGEEDFRFDTGGERDALSCSWELRQWQIYVEECRMRG